MRYHGNWCGPGWSDGAEQTSVRGFAPAVDEFDETCRQHDFAMYDSGGNDPLADVEFFLKNQGKGFKRDTAAWLVAGRLTADKVYNGIFTKHVQDTSMCDVPSEGLFFGDEGTCQPGGFSETPAMSPATNKIKQGQHDNSNYFSPNLEEMVKQTQKPGKKISKPMPKRVQTLRAQARTVAAPVSFGTQISISAPRITRNNSGAAIVGTDFIGTVEGQGVSTFGLGKSALLSPAYFSSSYLGSLCRSYERYRWKKLVIHYIPKVATSTAGQVIMCSQHNCTNPALSGESGNFLQRAMSQNNAVFTPVWQRASIEIDCSRKDWCLVDPTTNVDIDDNIYEELQVYSQVAVAQQPGFLVAEYSCEFRDPIYQPHSATIPLSTGPGLRAVFQDELAANAIGMDWALTCTTPLTLSQIPNGTIYRAVFDLQGSAAGTGTTFNNMLNSSFVSRTTTAVSTTFETGMPLVGGVVLYLKVTGSVVKAYVSLEDAVSGGTQLFFKTATTAQGTFNFDIQQVRLDALNLTSVQ